MVVAKPADQPAAQTPTQEAIDEARLTELTGKARVLTPEEVAKLGLPPGSYQTDAKGVISKIGDGGLTVKDRNALVERAKLLPDFYRAVDQIEGLYRKGFKDQGLATPLEYLPGSGRLAGLRPINQQLNNASDSLVGTIAQIQGLTGGEMNSLAELKARFGPMLPQAGEPDEVIEQKIANLRAMAGSQRSAIAEQLGPDAEKYFGGGGAAPATSPDAPHPTGPGDIGFAGAESDPRPAFTPAQQAAYDAWWAVNPNATPEQLAAFGNSIGVQIHNAADIIEARAKGLGVRPAADAIVNTPDISDVRGNGGIAEGADAAVRGAADTLSFGLSDELSAVADTVASGGTFADNLARERAIDDYDAENHGWLRGSGQVAGGFALPLFSARSPEQLAKVGAAYGAAYGFGSGEDLGSRVTGVATGAGIGAAAGWGGGKLVDKLKGRAARPPKAPGQSAEYVASAEKYGIDAPLEAAGGRGSKIVGQTLSNMPGSAGVMNSARQKVAGQVEAAVDNVGSTYGTANSFVGTGDAAQRGARTWISKFEEVSGKTYDAIPISPKATAQVNNTRQALEELTTIFESNPKLAEAFSNSRLNTYLEALDPAAGGGLSWGDLKALRSRIGEEIGEQRFSDSPTKGELRRLYAALSEDMRQTAEGMGPKAVRAFERANNLYREGQDRIDNALVSLLGDDGKKPAEAAARLLQTISKSGKGSSDLRKFQEIRKSMPAEEWGDVASSLLRLLGQPANSEGREFSAQTFIRNFDDMDDAAKNLLFGDRGRKELRTNLEEFSDVVRGLAASDALRNTSNTAGQVLTGLGFYSIGNIPALLTQIGSSYAAARLMTSPRFVKWATGYTKMLKGANKAKAAPSAAGIKTHLKLLEKVAASEPALAQDISGLQNALRNAFEQSPGRAAAGQQEDN